MDGCANNPPDSEIDRLRAEIDMLTKSGIIEVAIRNPSVSDYMEHWEGRATKAEEELTRLRSDLEKAKEALRPFANTSYLNGRSDMDVVGVYVHVSQIRAANKLLSQLENSK